MDLFDQLIDGGGETPKPQRPATFDSTPVEADNHGKQGIVMPCTAPGCDKRGFWHHPRTGKVTHCYRCNPDKLPYSPGMDASDVQRWQYSTNVRDTELQKVFMGDYNEAGLNTYQVLPRRR